MGLQIGIVGLPNVGKSTLFQALTGSKSAAVANYPFCTIDPNIGIISVPDPRLDRLCQLIQPKKVIPSTIQLVDIAGLIKGASQGEGLGNQFLTHIRQMEAIVHVVRCFEDDNIIHVSGKVDPIQDLEIIQTELILADLQQVERKAERSQKASKADATMQERNKTYQKMLSHLGNGFPAGTLELSIEEKELLDELGLITMKPYLYIANVSEAQLTSTSPQEIALRALAEKQGVAFIKVCAQVESELAEMPPDEAALFLAELGIPQSGLIQLAQACYQLLDQITFFTAGKVEVRAWNVLKGSTAPQAAGCIHTDFERGFIRAEVFHFSDLDQLKTETAVKEAGKWRLEGKEYLIQDGDIVHFRFNV